MVRALCWPGGKIIAVEGTARAKGLRLAEVWLVQGTKSPDLQLAPSECRGASAGFCVQGLSVEGGGGLETRPLAAVVRAAIVGT